jgi:RimJ/RimL family protein N-acetyltransferase
MLQINPDQVTPELKSMFNLTMPTGIRALAVLAGGNAGKIFTDNPAHPDWGLVWEADDGSLYRGGNYDKQVLCDAVALLRRDGVVALGFRASDPAVEFFPPAPDAGAECLEFERPIGSSDLSPYLGELPPGYTLRRMDRGLLEHSPKAEENLNRYGSLENFLDRGIAVCILQGDEIVCEAYADMEIMGSREIGIRTQESHRKQRLATCACAQLIQLCEEAGSRTYWDCVRLNAGSVALAHKLGFQHERAYNLLAWFKPKD